MPNQYQCKFKLSSIYQGEELKKKKGLCKINIIFNI